MSGPTEQPHPGRARVIAMARFLAPIQEKTRREQEQKQLTELLGKKPLKAVDKWIVAQNDPAIDRPEAIRRLVEIGLQATSGRRGKAVG